MSFSNPEAKTGFQARSKKSFWKYVLIDFFRENEICITYIPGAIFEFKGTISLKMFQHLPAFKIGTHHPWSYRLIAKTSPETISAVKPQSKCWRQPRLCFSYYPWTTFLASHLKKETKIKIIFYFLLWCVSPAVS